MFFFYPLFDFYLVALTNLEELLFYNQQQQNLEKTMIDYSNLSEDQYKDFTLKQNLSAFQRKNQPFKFLQHLNNKIEHKNHSSFFQDSTAQTSNFRLEQSLNQINSSSIKLKQMKTYNSHYNREETQIFQYSKSHPLGRQHLRKKFIIQKKISQSRPLNGVGFTKLNDGKVVFGKWKNGGFIGNAKIIYPTQNVYIGEVKNYNRHGRGLLILKSGERYVGNFANGKYDGYGTKYDVNFQRIYEGVWRQGNLIKSVE